LGLFDFYVLKFELWILFEIGILAFEFFFKEMPWDQ